MILQKGPICQNSIVAREVWLGIPAPLKGTGTILVVTVGEGPSPRNMWGVFNPAIWLLSILSRPRAAKRAGWCRQSPKPLRRRWLETKNIKKCWLDWNVAGLARYSGKGRLPGSGSMHLDPFAVVENGSRMVAGHLGAFLPCSIMQPCQEQYIKSWVWVAASIFVSAQPWAAIPTCYMPQWHHLRWIGAWQFFPVKNDTHRSLSITLLENIYVFIYIYIPWKSSGPLKE